MKHRRHAALTASSLLITVTLLGLSLRAAADPGVTLVGTGFIAGNALDLSGLDGIPICQRDDHTVCIDQATLGGLGSGLTYTGHDGVFLAAPDRGPFDGRTSAPNGGPAPYLDRVHFLYMAVDTSAPFPNITTKLLDTRFLKAQGNKNLLGDAYAFDPNDPSKTLRFDPEGVVVSPLGTFFISDEYGPYIREFNNQGHLIRKIKVPEKFLLDPESGNQSGDVDSGGNSLELYPTFNVTGRQANRGMEGLAITPNGRTLVGIMQNALLQDHGLVLDSAGLPARRGFNNRILTIDLLTGTTHEYVYVMDAVNQGRGVNDLLAINDHEFLVLERDNRTKVPTPPNAAQTPNLKQIYRIDLNETGLTDVSGTASLPELGTALAGLSIKPVTKVPFLNLLDSSYVVNAATVPPTTIKDVIAEKVEGMAWGPDLPNGKHLLFVTTDNDLFAGDATHPNGLPTQIYGFSVDGAHTLTPLNYQRQVLPEPLFPPGQVKKALRH